MGDNVDISALRIHRDASTPGDANQRSRRWILVVMIIVLVAATGYFFIFTGAADPEVEVSTVVRSSAIGQSSILTASGYVVAQRKAAVASKGTGRLEYLGVEEGDRVTKGQIIARLENSDVLAALATAKANLTVARADSAEAALNLQRQQALEARDLTSQSSLDAAKTAYQKVLANISLAHASIREAGVAVENTIIRAPFDGTVLTKNADVGEIVAPFAASTNSKGAVVTIADMTSLEVEADVSESNITLVKLNQPCEIVLDAYPDQRYKGYVKKIVPTADRGKATVMTKVAFVKLDHRVLPEMSTKVQFLSEDRSSAENDDSALLTIPGTAIVQRDQKVFVFLVKNGSVEEREIRAGQSLQGRMVVLEGLQQGDRVVRRPAADLKNGMKIKVKR